MSIDTIAPYRQVEGTALHRAVDERDRPIGGSRVALVAWMHGNEPVGGRTLEAIEQALPEQLRAGSVLTVRANLQAQAAASRHTEDGRDMNRLWDRANLERIAALRPGDRCYEEQRVHEIAPLLSECDAVLDLHSTSRPAPPFLLFRDDQRHAQLAHRLGVRRLVTGIHEGAILEGGLSMTVGLRPGERSSRLGFTFEAGQHVDPANAERAIEVTTRLLAALGLWREAPSPVEVEAEVYEVMDRFRQAPRGAEAWHFVGFGDDPSPTGRRGPPRRLVSFERVEADEALVRRGDRVVRAEAPFTMLMPAPTAEPGADLYYVAQPRHGGLGVLERTDGEARQEARAVERMLDLLDDDGFAAGSTWVSCEDRLLLDLCAELVGRAMRLPEGHPHRRITVVGRGDWGGDEAERRAGQRYRRAMRQALVQGVPLERIQLLRGASLGWLDSLTSESTAGLLARRREQTGQVDVDLYLSARQPHTLSLLVVGDVDRALREGDTRFVRVALVIEAATVQAVDDEARVHVVRTGLVSGRPEVVRAAWRLRDALHAEHRALVRRRPLADEPGLQGVMGPHGALCPTGDRNDMAVLRRAFRRLQLHLWRDALPADLLRPGPLDAAGVASWLARTMAATGIRDVPSLRSLLAPAGPARWRVEPERLEAGCEEPGSFAPSPPPHAPTPPQPLQAAEVDADNLERWAGWKRYVRRAQVIPDTRGKDVDLALTRDAIHRRVVALYRRAAEMGRGMPGRVLVAVAGDGQSPLRVDTGTSRDTLSAHRELLRDPHVRYLRIQHAQGTHLAWMKDLLSRVAERPGDRAPVHLQLEAEHGALVNVVLLAVRDTPLDHDPWSLEGWRLEGGGLVLTEFEVARREYAVGLFTGTGPGDRLDLDLLHFGRSHCQGLLDQAGPRVLYRGDETELHAFERILIDRIAGWVRTVRAAADREVSPPPFDPEGRRRWVADELGLADPVVVGALADEIGGERPAAEVARSLWAAQAPWPGPAEGPR